MTKPRPTSMHRDGDVEHHAFSDGSRLSVRVDWTPEDAATGLVREWLDGLTDTDHTQVAQQHRTIRDAAGKPIGYLISPDEYEEGQRAISTVNGDAYGHKGDQYMPFQHAPNATTDRIINTETLERIITKIRHGSVEAAADLTAEEKRTIHYEALVAALSFGFDPDSRGMVPVLTPGRVTDSPTAAEYYWSLLYPTPVAGLFVRADDAILGHIHYTIVAGSGYKLVGDFWEREYADELAVKLGKAMPGLDWFQVNNTTLTTELKQTAVEIIREHGRWRREPPAAPATESEV
ncbi:hypothetical protein AB0P19_02210 [Microbacterium oleivorans]|uniref:hypothetical protein n=1 Tax=Microbacterium oleivorans TaxID=273677 RepID=UPI00342DBECF